LRLGIGNNFPKGRQPEFVLGRWTEAELAVVNAKVERSVELIETFATSGIERTMSQYNKLDFGL
jgi:PTH1 family peptidyl-tRNA hydrolase